MPLDYLEESSDEGVSKYTVIYSTACSLQSGTPRLSCQIHVAGNENSNSTTDSWHVKSWEFPATLLNTRIQLEGNQYWGCTWSNWYHSWNWVPSLKFLKWLCLYMHLKKAGRCFTTYYPLFKFLPCYFFSQNHVFLKS